jgi:hypothetical protein|tara:strand:- start:10463 stop:10726 length:264 start_codon:yes stop_codon:yes gene_type:complete
MTFEVSGGPSVHLQDDRGGSGMIKVNVHQDCCHEQDGYQWNTSNAFDKYYRQESGREGVIHAFTDTWGAALKLAFQLTGGIDDDTTH